MAQPRTLFEMAGVSPEPSRLGAAALLLIDCQREYVDGQLALTDVTLALNEIASLLHRARAAGRPVLHVVHRGRANGPFDPAGPGFEVAPPVAPQAGETVLEKTLPNAFAGTELQATLNTLGIKELIVVGFMTHMCISSTVRAALDVGLRCTVVANATATRDLPALGGGTVGARSLQSAALAALADRFAAVVRSASDVPD